MPRTSTLSARHATLMMLAACFPAAWPPRLHRHHQPCSRPRATSHEPRATAEPRRLTRRQPSGAGAGAAQAQVRARGQTPSGPYVSAHGPRRRTALDPRPRPKPVTTTHPDPVLPARHSSSAQYSRHAPTRGPTPPPSPALPSSPASPRHPAPTRAQLAPSPSTPPAIVRVPVAAAAARRHPHPRSLSRRAPRRARRSTEPPRAERALLSKPLRPPRSRLRSDRARFDASLPLHNYRPPESPPTINDPRPPRRRAPAAHARPYAAQRHPRRPPGCPMPRPSTSV